MLREVAVERHRFACTGCGHGRTVDHDVQRVGDGHGPIWEYHALNGMPVPSPTAPGSLGCPQCGATRIHFQLAAVRALPLAGTSDPTDLERPRRRLDAERQAARRQAPPLRGDRPIGVAPAASGSSGTDP